MPLNPREIVDVKDEPVVDPTTKTAIRIDPTTQQVSEPMRRAVTYRDGSVEYFEWDKRGEQPPGPVPWGRKLPTTGVNQPIQNDWAQAQKTEEATAKGQVFETPGGLVRVPPGGNPELIYPTQPNRAPVNVGEGGGRIFDPATGQTTNIPPTQTYIDQQAQAQAAQQDTAAERWATFFRQQYADQISQAVSQGTLSETQATNLWSRMSDVFVNWPKAVGAEARATETTRQTGASNAGRYGLDVTQEARTQGQNAVDDAKYLAEHTAVGTGYSGMPDLEGARQRTAQALYARMPDYQALLAQQPALPYYGADELAQTQSLALPYIFGGGGGGTAPQPAPQPPAYAYNPAPAPQPAYPPYGTVPGVPGSRTMEYVPGRDDAPPVNLPYDRTDPRQRPWIQLMSGGY